MEKQERNEHILQELADWGCDMPGALARFVGNKELYCRLLAGVPQEEAFTALGQALSAGDTHAAFEQAHALKGMLGNMGLTEMYGEACEIVEPLRAGTAEGTAAHYQALMRGLQKLEKILNGEGRW